MPPAATDMRKSGADGCGLSELVGIVGEPVDLIGMRPGRAHKSTWRETTVMRRPQ
jgi:hypothetical protein